MSAALLALVLAGNIWATTDTIAVVPLEITGAPDDPSVEAQIVAGLEGSEGPRPLAGDALAARLQPDRRRKQVEAAARRAERGRTAYRKLEFEQAAKDLDAAQRELLRLHDYVENVSVADVLLDLGLVRLELKDPEGAIAAFQKARLYGAPKTLDPRFFPKAAMGTYARGSARAEENGTGTIVVRAVPGGSTVFFDGGRAGTAPLVISDVVTGRHAIRIRSSDEAVVMRTAHVKSGETVRVDVRLPEKPVPPRITFRGDADALFAAELRLGHAAGSRWVVSWGLVPSRNPGEHPAVLLRLVDVQSGILLDEKQIPAPAMPAQIEQAVSRLIEKTTRHDPRKPAFFVD